MAFAEGATTNKEALAKAIIDLADAIARGDDKKFAGLIGPEEKTLLRSLTSSGDWKEETSRIEGVRILNIREGGDVAASVAIAADSGADSSLVSLLKVQLKMMPPEAKAELAKSLGHEPTEADTDKLIEMARNQLATLREGGTLPGMENISPEMMKMATEHLEKMITAYDESVAAKKAAAPADAASADSDTKFTVVFAVQEPGSAFAQSWVAVPLGEKWVFKASSGQLPASRVRASEFDVLFGGGGGDADKPADKPADDKPKDTTPAPVAPRGSKGGGSRGG